MYTLRFTRPLLSKFDETMEEASAVVATTRLGDWYVVPFTAGRRRLLACASARTELTLVMPRPPLPDVPQALGVALVPVLRALRVDDEAIAAELDEMAEGGVGAAVDLALLARLRGQAKRAAATLEAVGSGQVDVAALHASLNGQLPAGEEGLTAAERTHALFRRPSSVRHRRPAASEGA